MGLLFSGIVGKAGVGRVVGPRFCPVDEGGPVLVVASLALVIVVVVDFESRGLPCCGWLFAFKKRPE